MDQVSSLILLPLPLLLMLLLLRLCPPDCVLTD
jgi:hypothetical protein